jgi:hypothetical protein
MQHAIFMGRISQFALPNKKGGSQNSRIPDSRFYPAIKQKKEILLQQQQAEQ